MGTAKERSASTARSRLPRRSGSSAMGRVGSVRLRDGPKQGISSTRGGTDMRLRVAHGGTRPGGNGLRRSGSSPRSITSLAGKPDGVCPVGQAVAKTRHATAPVRPPLTDQRLEGCDGSQAARLQRQLKAGYNNGMLHHSVRHAEARLHRSLSVESYSQRDAECSGILNERDSSDEDMCMVPAEECTTPRRRTHPNPQRVHNREPRGSKGTEISASNCERLPFAEHYADLGEADFASLILDCRGEKRELVMLRGSFKLSEITRFEPWVLAKTKFSKLLGGSTGQQAGKLQKLHQRLLQSTDAIEAPWYADCFRVNRADGSWFKAVLVFVPITLRENINGSEILCLLLNADEPGNQTERDACVDLLQNGRSESILLSAAQFLNQRKAQAALALNFEPRVPLVVL